MPTINLRFYKFPAKWQLSVAVMTLMMMGIYFLLPAIGEESTRHIPLLLVIAIGGLPLIIEILRNMLKGNLSTDLLAAIAIITAVSLQEYLTASLVMLMLASGQTLESYAVSRASSVLSALAKRMPVSAHRKSGQHIEDVPLGDIKIGDTIVIYPHETCPVDGMVIEGHGRMDESYLTGEPYHMAKAVGSTVLSGAINGEAALTIRAEKLPEDSRYAKIMQVMAEAEQHRPQLRRLGDQIGAVFVPIALAVAIGTWIVTGMPIRFLAVLVIATPCPLLIAIPVTIISAISLAAKRGIIIKNPTALERLPICETAIFDKTGTLTYGKPELVDVVTSKILTPDSALQQAASLERYSKHPLAEALIRAASAAKLYLLEPTDISEKPGQGLTGYVGEHQLALTGRDKIGELRHLLPPAAGGLECVLLVDGHYAALFRFRDAPRKEGRPFIHHLTPVHRFKRIMLVSGDRESEVTYLASLMGIKEIYANQSPEQKVALVSEAAQKAPTLFVGDGINDAPALAVATVGIAFGQHSDITSEAAGAVILDNTLLKVDELLHISIKMRRIALQSAVGGMVLSIIGMGFAAAGMISQVTGAILQEVIDLMAIINALRLTWQRAVRVDIESNVNQAASLRSSKNIIQHIASKFPIK